MFAVACRRPTWGCSHDLLELWSPADLFHDGESLLLVGATSSRVGDAFPKDLLQDSVGGVDAGKFGSISQYVPR